MWRQAAYVFPLHGTPFVFHSSWRPDVFSWCFSYRLWKNILYYRWITTNFRQYNWPRKANKTTVYSKSGCKFSPEQEQNAELKFNASNKEEDDSRKSIALPSEEEAVDDRRKDSCHCGILFCFVFFAASVFNSIHFFWNAEGQNTAFTMRTKPMKRRNYRRFEKVPPISNEFPTTA